MADFDFVYGFPRFAGFIKRSARYVLDDQNRRFLEAVLQTCPDLEITMEKGTGLWRAQADHGWRTETIIDENGAEIQFDTEAPCSIERMKPLVDRAKEGRVNPKGIPCLYLSTDRDTAMVEVRPWIGSYVSVAEFTVLRDLRLVDCSSKTEMPVGDKPQQWAWWYINRAFSEPVTGSEDIADYTPTQVLAEAFRSIHFDGIVYGSKLGKGSTVALFDLTAAESLNCRLFQVEGVNFRFSEVAKPRFYCRDQQQSDPGATAEPKNKTV